MLHRKKNKKGGEKMDGMENNVLSKINNIKKLRKRGVRILSPTERERLLAVCQKNSPYLHLLVVLTLYTEAKLFDLINLRWNEVDLQKGSIILHDRDYLEETERWLISLVGYPLEVLRNYAKKFTKKKTEWVFPSTRGDKPINIRKAWNNARKEAEIPDFRFYDLHRTALYFPQKEVNIELLTKKAINFAILVKLGKKIDRRKRAEELQNSFSQ